MIKKHFIYRLIVLLLCLGCVEVIDFENENTDGQLAIYGQINNSQDHDQSIRVTRATTSRAPSKIVNNATVELTDGSGMSYPYRYDTLNRYYVPDPPFTGIPGQTYQLTIELDGEVYRSSEQCMPLTTGQDTTYFEIRETPVLSQTGGETTAYFMQAYTDTEIPVTEEPIFLRWDILQVWVVVGIVLPSSNFPGWSPPNCYIEETYIGDQLVLYDGREVGPGILKGQFMAETLLNESFQTLRGFGIVKQSITEEALDYWKKVGEVSNRVGSIFETPPAPIPGNISNINDPDEQVLGFFEVAQVDTTGTFVTPDDLPVFIGRAGDLIDCEEIPFSRLFSVPYQCFPCLIEIGVDPGCLRCDAIPNATGFRPTYLFDSGG